MQFGWMIEYKSNSLNKHDRIYTKIEYNYKMYKEYNMKYKKMIIDGLKHYLRSKDDKKVLL